MTQALQDIWPNVQGRHSGAIAGEKLGGEIEAAIAGIAAEHAANEGLEWQPDTGRTR